MKKNIHPAYFIYSKNSPYFREYESIKITIWDDENMHFFKAAYYENLNTSDVNSVATDKKITISEILLSINFDQYSRESNRKNNVIIGSPVVIFFIEEAVLYNELIKKLVAENFFYYAELAGYTFYNVFVRNLKRYAAPASEKESIIYREVEALLLASTNKIQLASFYNIVLDNFNEITSIKFSEDPYFSFKQLGDFLFFLLYPSMGDAIKLNHCNQPVLNKNDTPIRYNIFGMANMGFNLRKVKECIGLYRKSSFLEKFIAEKPSQELEIDVLFQKKWVEHSDIIRITFQKCLILFGNTISDAEYLRNSSGQESMRKFHASNCFKDRLAHSLHPFKKELRNLESRIKQQHNASEQVISGLLMESVSCIINVTQEGGIVAAIYFLNGLPENGQLAEFQNRSDKELLELIYVERETDLFSSLDYPFEYSEHLMHYIIQIEQIETEIHKLNEEQDAARDKNNTLIDQVTDKLINPVNVVADYVRSNGLERQYEEAVDKFYSEYHNYINLQLKRYIDKACRTFSIATVIASKRIAKALTCFRQSLSDLSNYYKDLYENFELEDDYFNSNLISKTGIIAYCKKKMLKFFGEKDVSFYFNEFLRESNYYSTLHSISQVTKLAKDERIEIMERHSNCECVYLDVIKSDNLSLCNPTQHTVQISYTDIKQSKELNDCYLLAALASIAAVNPHYIKNILELKDNFASVTLHNPMGEAYKVEVDYNFWFNSNTNQPLYAGFGSNSEQELNIWVMLIEKAWAKFNGKSYEKINYDPVGNHIRKIDYSLALMGRMAVRENFTKVSNSDILIRIAKHMDLKKPVVLYSLDHDPNGILRHYNISPNHAYALVEVIKDEIFDELTNRKCLLYDPRSSKISEIPLELFICLFSQVLYFYFTKESDNHLRGLYSEYFISRMSLYKSIIANFDALSKEDIRNSIEDKSFEQLMSENLFDKGIDIDEKKVLEFSRKIVEASIPFVYLSKMDYSPYLYYFLGTNKLMQENILEELKKEGIDTKGIESVNSYGKKMGLLRIRNNLKIDHIIGDISIQA